MKNSTAQPDLSPKADTLTNPGGLAFGIYCTVTSLLFSLIDSYQEELSIASLISIVFGIGSYAIGYRLFRNIAPVIGNNRIATYMYIQLILAAVCVPLLLSIFYEEDNEDILGLFLLLLAIAGFVFELLMGIALRKETKDPTGGILKSYGTILLIFTPIALFFDIVSAFDETLISTYLGTLAASVTEIGFILLLIRFRRILPPRENTRGQAVLFTLLAMLTIGLLKIALQEML